MKKGGYMLTAAEIAEELSCSKGHAYKLIRQLNSELSQKGYLVIPGRVPKKYWSERIYGYSAN